MAVKRAVSLEKYIRAGIITLLIFTLGITLGIIMDNERVKWADKQNKEQEIDLESLQFQYLYIATLDKNQQQCAVLRKALEKSVEIVGETLDQFAEYMKETRINDDEYEITARKYVIDNLRYWFFAKTSKQICDLDMVNVLYFYSTDDCTSCPDQGTILTYYKKLYDERLLVFPLDVDLAESEGSIEILMTRYNVTLDKLPILIIGDELFSGVQGTAQLGPAICRAFHNATNCKY